MKNYYKPVKILFLCCFQFLITQSFGQCPVSNFSVVSPICPGSTLHITNHSTGATSYNWDFSPGFFTNHASLLTDTSLSLSYPGDISLVTQNDTNIIFLSGFGDGHLHRLVYGNGPQNPATLVEDLGGLGALYQPSDINFFKQDSVWYGFVVDAGSNYLFRLRFGNGLLNTPDSVTTVLTAAASGFNGPWSVKISSDSTGAIFGLVCNHNNGTISILSFGNSILNIPAVTAPLSVTGAGYVDDGILAYNCGNWYAFLGGTTSTHVIRADFGNSLLNSPTFNTIISDGYPNDFILINDSSHWKLLYTDLNAADKIKKYDLGTDLANNSPVLIGTESFAGANPKGICYSRKDNEIFLYILNGSHNVQTLGYVNQVNTNKSTSTDFAPADIVFTSSGVFPVSLLISDDHGNYSSFTDTVVVKPAPQTNFSATNKCFGDSVLFSDSSAIGSGTINSWEWNFDDGDSSASQNNIHKYLSTGSYNVRLITSSSYGCYDTLIQTVDITLRPQSSFSTPPASCSNSGMQFTDYSTVGAGVINNWTWRFGNGDTSVLQNPNYSFPSGGSYTVSLTVTTAAGCSDSSSGVILVNSRPAASFTATNTCVGQNVSFTDHSVVSNSSITNYQWDFGDGNTDTTSNPQHLYPAIVAAYPSRLIITAANGCIDTSYRTIKINNIPVVNFSIPVSSVCQNNNVSFSDLSTVTGDTISGWMWDFGDYTFDSIQNPVHQYSTPGIYNVSLITYSPSSCPGTAMQQSVTVIESPVASYIYSTTCLGDNTHFTNTSVAATGSSIASVLWHFTSNDSTLISSPDFAFSTAGNYPVILKVISPEGCFSSDTESVRVHERPVSAFSAGIACSKNATQFTNESTCDTLSSISQYNWNFGDVLSGTDNISALPDPSHAYDTTFSYNASLIVTTNYGCKDTTIQTIHVSQSPSAQFAYSPTCYGDLMEFFNPGSQLDSSYLWTFGDNQTNQLREPAHYYAFPGTYTVSLNVIASSGCVTVASKQVSVSPIPVAGFATTPACVNTGYTFHDNSTITSGSIVKWNWNIPGLPKPDSIPNPSYVFNDTGNYNVTLTVISDIGCTKNYTNIISAHSIPVASFSFDPQFGNPPLEIQTTDLSEGGAYYHWDFGDGVDVNMQEPTHIYTDTGQFMITQYVTSLYGCTDTVSKNIYVIKPILDIAITGDSSYYEENYFHIVGRLENHGTREVDGLQMEARLENGNTIREVLPDPVPNGPLGFYTYPFHAAFLITPGSDFKYYCIKAVLPDGLEDNTPENNERCFNMTDNIVTMNPFPNPFVQQLTFRLILPKSGDLLIDISDMSGRVMKTLYNARANKNLFELKAELTDLPDGVYTARIIYGDEVTVKYVVKNNHEE